ncbi:MAG: TonB-dependent receptor [Candidatus Methylacidiphilales bacterium]|nr:TonB-dependent receptor [Candidatus Methylacidiphilales bacterium]
MLILWGLLSSGAMAQQAGGIRGSIKDADFADPLENARVTIQELNVSAVTGPGGTYVFQDVPAGVYTLIITKSGYNRGTRPEVLVRPGQLTEANQDLASEIFEMEEVVVQAEELVSGTEVALLELRQDTSALVDSIGSAFISKAGASDAGDALKLVTGTSVQDGKYVVIRGLGDRYSSVLLNGARVPSSDPKRRAVQLDLFPTATIESITVQKSPSPDQPGEFTGGGVNIVTKGIPEGTQFSIGGGVEYNTQATGASDFLTDHRGGPNFFGYDESRNLPEGITSGGVPNTLPTNLVPNNPAGLALRQSNNALTRAFGNGIGTREGEAGPGYSYDISYGTRLDLKEAGLIGIQAALSYKRKFEHDGEGTINELNSTEFGAVLADGISIDSTRSVINSKEEVVIGSLLTTAYQWNEDNQVSLTLVGNSNTDSTNIRELEDVDIDFSPGTRFRLEEKSTYQERLIASAQLRGEHKLTELNDAKVEWLSSTNFSRLNEPDKNFFVTQFRDLGGGVIRSEVLPFANSGEGTGRRIYTLVEDKNQQLKIDFTLPFEQWSEQEGFVKFGPYASITRRDYNQNSFAYGTARGALGSNGSEGDSFAEEYLDPDNIGLDPTNPRGQLVTIFGLNQSDIDYNANENIFASYGMVELPFTENFKISGGARIELTQISSEVIPHNPNGTVSVPTSNPGDPLDTTIALLFPENLQTDLESFHILPSVGATYTAFKDVNVRLNWGRTIARPTFRELVPAVQTDPVEGDVFSGNPSLKISEIDNYDFRVEWFPRPGDVLAFGGFYKQIKAPIESVIKSINGGSGGYFETKENLGDGELIGAEAEASKNLGFIHEVLKFFSIGTNAAYIRSEVEVTPALRAAYLAQGFPGEVTRPLEAQPEYIINANLTYDNPDTGTKFGLFYNWIGEQLVAGGSIDPNTITPSRYLLPTEELNVSFSQKFWEHWTLTARAKNLTDPVQEQVYRLQDLGEEGDVTRRTSSKGITMSLGVKYDW